MISRAGLAVLAIKIPGQATGLQLIALLMSLSQASTFILWQAGTGWASLVNLSEAA